VSNNGYHRKKFRGFCGGDFTGEGGRNSALNQKSLGEILETSRKSKEVQEKLKEYDEARKPKLSKEEEVFIEWGDYTEKIDVSILSESAKCVPQERFRFQILEDRKAVLIYSPEKLATSVFIDRSMENDHYYVYKLNEENGSRQYLLSFKYKRVAQNYACLLAYYEIQEMLETALT